MGRARGRGGRGPPKSGERGERGERGGRRAAAGALGTAMWLGGRVHGGPPDKWRRAPSTLRRRCNRRW
eukprot:3503722-Prymnesium_polylepis.1